MTADRYSAEELPGVLKQLRKDYETWDDNYETCTAQIAGDRLLLLFPRLLSTLEAMRDDADKYLGLLERFYNCGFEPTERLVQEVDALFDAARREGGDE